MKKTEQITDIPDEHVDVVVADFEAIGAQVTKSRQSNGNWTVTAVISESSQQTYVA
jgi:hypothetical protein